MILVINTSLLLLLNSDVTRSNWNLSFFLNNMWWNPYLLVLVGSSLTHKFFVSWLIINISSALVLKLPTVSLLPQTLLLGYNNVHPLFFYSTFIAFTQINLNTEYSLNVKHLTLLFLGIISLVLGGYWGLHNNVWGYFWVDDFIETTLLLMITIIVAGLHVKQSKRIAQVSFLCYTMLILKLILARYGLVFTRHNFFDLSTFVNGGSFFVVFNSQLLLLLFIFLINFTLKWSMLLFFVYFLSEKEFAFDMPIKLLFFHATLLAMSYSWVKFSALHNSNFVLKNYVVASFYTKVQGYLTIQHFFITKFLIAKTKIVANSLFATKIAIYKNLVVLYGRAIFGVILLILLT